MRGRRETWVARAGLALALVGIVLAASGAAETAPRHVLLLTVDTLRADRLGAYGSDLGLTPNLDRLASRSDRFAATYAPTPFTLPSLAGLMTGRHPRVLGVESNEDRVSGGVPTLARAFAARGFRTGAVVSSIVLRRETGMDAGFEAYDIRLPQREAVRRFIRERRAGRTTDAAIAMLRRLRRDPEDRIFLWVHYQDPHGPYTPPRSHRARHLAAERARPDGRRLLERLDALHGLGGIPSYQYLHPHREVAWYRAGYDGEVSYLDSEIGRLLAAVERLGLMEESAVIFTADHGESLGEDGLWFAHGSRLNEASLRVPLLVRIPSRPPAVHHPVASLLDLAPTLDALFDLGLALPDARRDLLERTASPAESRVFLSTPRVGHVEARIGLVEGNAKLVRTLDPDAPRERLEVIDGDAPDGPGREERAARLRAALDTFARRTARSAAGPARQLSERERRELRALGYLDAAGAEAAPE